MTGSAGPSQCPKGRCKRKAFISGLTEMLVPRLVFLHIPGHVSAAGNDLIVVQKPTTAEVAGVARQFPADADIAFSGL